LSLFTRLETIEWTERQAWMPGSAGCALIMLQIEERHAPSLT
jgi:hypothetical protein